MSITREEIKIAVAHMEQYAIKPKVVNDRAEADRMNATEVAIYAMIGMKSDEYY